MSTTLTTALSTEPSIVSLESTINHFKYNPVTDKLEADKAIETTLNSLFLGEQHKMSSGSENIFFTNLSSDINYFPMWGGLKDQSLVANQGASGFIPPSGRIFSDMFSLPLRGNPDPSNNIFRIGRANNVHNNYLGSVVNQVAIWDSNQDANVSTIYNSGATQDLSLLSSAPTHYYEIENSVTTITDSIGSASLVGYNFASTDLVSDTP